MIFSKDGSIIQVNDNAFTLAYYNTDSGLQINEAKYLRDIEWSSWSSICGWPVQVHLQLCFVFVPFLKKYIFYISFISLGHS